MRQNVSNGANYRYCRRCAAVGLTGPGNRRGALRDQAQPCSPRPGKMIVIMPTRAPKGSSSLTDR